MLCDVLIVVLTVRAVIKCTVWSYPLRGSQIATRDLAKVCLSQTNHTIEKLISRLYFCSVLFKKFCGLFYF